MVKKQTLIMDFDGVLTNPYQAYCSVYNKLFTYYPDFKYADWTECREYNLSDVCPLAVDICEEIFGYKEFFDNLEFMEDSTLDMLKQLNEDYNLIICTIGNYNNITYKSQWIQDNLSFIEDVIFIKNANCIANKSIVNMKDAIFVDDMPSNLFSSNARYKMCYGKVYPWKKYWKGLIVLNNQELIGMIYKI